MFGKKKPVLTAAYCGQMSKLRLALEVYTGQYTNITCIDFNTGRGKAIVGSTEFDVSFCYMEDGVFQFTYHPLVGWLMVRMDQSNQVRVIGYNQQHKCGPHSMWWVGRSAAERWEEPLHLNHVEYAAQTRGLSTKEYLQKCKQGEIK